VSTDEQTALELAGCTIERTQYTAVDADGQVALRQCTITGAATAVELWGDASLTMDGCVIADAGTGPAVEAEESVRQILISDSTHDDHDVWVEVG
jgi:hypothetical protein